ncbi:hypothetical protein G9A89_002394 [Geosiphon pyriformis]|nr:hypothetical protein G9A89_002394 [Geosiphon pyriformis]
MLALKTIPELSITVTGNHINYTQTEVVTNLALNSQKYHPYKKNTRSYSGIYLPELDVYKRQELSITVTGNHINYTQTEVVTNLALNSQKYHPYKKNTRSYSGIYLPELLKLALRENLMLTPISISPNATIQQRLQLCLNEKNTEYPPIYRYFHIGKTLYKRKLNLQQQTSQKKLFRNNFTTNSRQQLDQQTVATSSELFLDFMTCSTPVKMFYKTQFYDL